MPLSLGLAFSLVSFVFVCLSGGREILLSSYELPRLVETSSGLLFAVSSFSCEVGTPLAVGLVPGPVGCIWFNSVQIDCAKSRACRRARGCKLDLGCSCCLRWPPNREVDDDDSESPASFVVRCCGCQNPKARPPRGAQHRRRSCSNQNACSHKSRERWPYALRKRGRLQPNKLRLFAQRVIRSKRNKPLPRHPFGPRSQRNERKRRFSCCAGS